MEPAKTPTAPPLSEAALPDISSSASGPEKGMLPNDKGMVSQSAPPAGPNQYELGNLTGVFLRSDDPHVQQQSQLMHQDKEMVMPSTPSAEPNHLDSSLWSQNSVSQGPQQAQKQQQNQLFPDEEIVFSYASLAQPKQWNSTFNSPCGFSSVPWQQDQMFPVSGQRHQQVDKIALSKSVAPDLHDVQSKFGKTKLIDLQANEQGTSKSEVSEFEQGKCKHILDGKKQQNEYCTSTGWISIEDILKEINGNNWLSNFTMEVCIYVLKEQFPDKVSLSALWEVILTSTLSATSNDIPRYKMLFDNYHWTHSWSTKTNQAFYIDSYTGPPPLPEVDTRLSPNLRNQIIQAHKVPYQGSLKVYFLDNVQQQKNGIDCGVFVIAFLVEFIFDPEIGTLETIEFDTSKMRSHLAECVEKREFSPFPKMKERDHQTKANFPGNRPYIIL